MRVASVSRDFSVLGSSEEERIIFQRGSGTGSTVAPFDRMQKWALEAKDFHHTSTAVYL